MKKTSPWAWIPTLYFAQGLPYVAVTIISLVMYKRLGISICFLRVNGNPDIFLDYLDGNTKKFPVSYWTFES